MKLKQNKQNKKMEQKTNLAKTLAVLVMATLVLVSGTLVFADNEAQVQAQVNAQEQAQEQEQVRAQIQEMEVMQGAEIVFTPAIGLYNTFSGTGYVIDTVNENGQAVRLVVSKNRAFPIAVLDKQGEQVMAQLQTRLGIAQESITEIPDSEVKTNVIKDKDVWSGTLTIGYGNFQGQYFVIGREQDNEIEFTVIPFDEYPIIMSELTVEKQIFPALEIWKGTLNLESSEYEGEWQLTAFSYRPFYNQPVPLEIQEGEQGQVNDYTIEPIAIKRVRLFGLLPIGKEQAQVKVWKGNELVAERTLKEGETAQIGNLTLKVVKIDDRLQVIAETETPVY